jgi:hypothetical protein
LHAAWNPKSPKDSAARSRVMTLEMTLVRATDALDLYISFAHRSPSLIQEAGFRSAVDSSGRSVLSKARIAKDHCPSMDVVIAALIEVMIAWRNRLVHSLADNDVSTETRKLLSERQSWIRNEFRGMEVDRLFSDFEQDGPPTFKEMASFIRATHEFVRMLDEAFLLELDTEQYLKSFIWSVVSRNPKKSKDIDQRRMALIQSVWGRDVSERHQRVISFLRNNGLSMQQAKDGAVFSDELLAELSAMNPKKLLDCIRPEG